MTLADFLGTARAELEALGTLLESLAQRADAAEQRTALLGRLRQIRSHSAWFPELRDFNRIVHALEDVIDVPEGSPPAPVSGRTDLLHQSLDLLERLLDRHAQPDGDAGLHHEAGLAQAEIETLIVALREVCARQSVSPQMLCQEVQRLASSRGRPAVPAWYRALPAELLASARAESARAGATQLSAAHYQPEPLCFVHGEDPMLLVRGTPGLAGVHAETSTSWPALDDFDPAHSQLCFTLLSSAPPAALRAHFRRVEEQVELFSAELEPAIRPRAALQVQPEAADPAATAPLLGAELAVFAQILDAQARLLVPGDPATRHGRWRSVARVAETLAGRIGAQREVNSAGLALEHALLYGEVSRLCDVLLRLEANLRRRGAAVLAGAPSVPGAPASAITPTQAAPPLLAAAPLARLQALIGVLDQACETLPELVDAVQGLSGAGTVAGQLRSHNALLQRVSRDLHLTLARLREP
jgi:chemotaxis protein histidine kinase CheA